MRASVLTLLLSTLVAGCDSAKVDEVLLDCGAFSSSFATEDSMQQPVSTFTTGETITLHARKTNSSNAPQTVHGETCPEVTYEVRDESGQVVWKGGSDHISVSAVCADSYTYAPGETTNHFIDWNQRRLNDGTQVSPGQYTAVLLDSTECGSALSKSIDFEIQ